jgi:hypothetical protein
MDRRIPKAPETPGPADLAHTLSLAERLMAPREEGGTAGLPVPPSPTLLKRLRYLLWRLSGRRLARGNAALVAENYEREMARLAQSVRAESDKALARERARVAELEKLTAQLQRAFETEAGRLREAAEERARLAENKVEMLKEALEITRARATPGEPTADTRFREAKRAFARCCHPDQGGRDDDAKRRIFLEFWPVLERIERGDI